MCECLVERSNKRVPSIWRTPESPPATYRMQSGRSTPELDPQSLLYQHILIYNIIITTYFYHYTFFTPILSFIPTPSSQFQLDHPKQQNTCIQYSTINYSNNKYWHQYYWKFQNKQHNKNGYGILGSEYFKWQGILWETRITW